MSHFQLRPEEEGCKGIFWEGGEGGGLGAAGID